MLHPLERAESLELPYSSHSYELCVKFISQAGLGRPLPHSSPSVWPLVWVTAPVNWEQQMVRQSYQAHSTTLKSCITKLKSSGARFWNSHLSKFTLNKKRSSLHIVVSFKHKSVCTSHQTAWRDSTAPYKHNSQYISGQLHNTSGWIKLRYRVTTASSKRQIVSEKPAGTCHLMTTGRRDQGDLLGVTATDKRVKDKVLVLSWVLKLLV